MSTGHHPTCFCFECRGDLRPPIVKAKDWPLFICHWCGERHEGGPENCGKGFSNEREPGRYYPAEKDGGTYVSLVSKYHSGKSGKGEQRPFLKTENVKKAGKKGMKFKIVQLRELAGGFSPLGLDVDTPSGNFTLGVKEDSVILSQLVQEFGKDERKWKNKSGTFVVVKDKYINLAAS